ncbi:MAG: flagellar basal-body rod protein FlgG [bacterium]
MMRGLYSAASGMTAQQTNLDIIANNLANVNTTGFKRSRADFQDLLYQTLSAAGSTTGVDSKVPTGIQIGLGVRTASVQKIFNQGEYKITNNSLDIAIEGDGFFQLNTPKGVAYTRDGAFKRDDAGNMVNSDGYALTSSVTIDTDAVSVNIGPDGSVSMVKPDSTIKAAGQIKLVRFSNPAGLISIGHNLYIKSAASGDAVEGEAGTNGLGSIAQNTLEMSNVSVVEEMVSMIVAQRAYETNSKAIQAADEMLSMANQLRR